MRSTVKPKSSYLELSTNIYTSFTANVNTEIEIIPRKHYLISAIHATSTATANPCTSAGCRRPAASTFSITDTQPMKTKNIVPTSSAMHGWIILSNLLGGLADFLNLSSEDLFISLSSTFSSSIFADVCCRITALLKDQGVTH